MSISGLMFKMACTKADRKRDAGLTIPEDITVDRDLRYGRDLKFNTLDVCFPTSREKDKLPLIINVHGGGYVYGSKDIYRFYAAELAKHGFAVVTFNYRLAPKHKFPTPLKDLNGVIKWIMSHADQYGFDLDNVFMVGDSAGAQITSQYATIYSDAAYRQIMGLKKPKLRLAAIGLACGMYDIKKMVEKEGPKGLVAGYLGKHPEIHGEMLDVTEHITGDYPATYVFSAPGDFLKDELAPMQELLTSKGVDCESKLYGDDKTGHVFHLDIRSELASRHVIDKKIKQEKMT